MFPTKYRKYIYIYELLEMDTYPLKSVVLFLLERIPKSHLHGVLHLHHIPSQELLRSPSYP